MNTGELCTRKPHLFYSRAQKQWICFHWGQGYIKADTMRSAYWRWLDYSGLIEKIGEQA